MDEDRRLITLSGLRDGYISIHWLPLNVERGSILRNVLRNPVGRACSEIPDLDPTGRVTIINFNFCSFSY